MFRALGTPAEHKRRVVYDASHQFCATVIEQSFDSAKSARVWVEAQFGVSPLPDRMKGIVGNRHVLQGARVLTALRRLSENNVCAFQPLASRFDRPCSVGLYAPAWRFDRVDVMAVRRQFEKLLTALTLDLPSSDYVAGRGVERHARAAADKTQDDYEVTQMSHVSKTPQCRHCDGIRHR
jgi:hypothetical protein